MTGWNFDRGIVRDVERTVRLYMDRSSAELVIEFFTEKEAQPISRRIPGGLVNAAIAGTDDPADVCFRCETPVLNHFVGECNMPYCPTCDDPPVLPVRRCSDCETVLRKRTYCPECEPPPSTDGGSS
ncbi:MAG: hypothetical protein IH885_04425 [Myxococcales bacterium]|nr:hypothetical protein [Myxococcales bacterium]